MSAIGRRRVGGLLATGVLLALGCGPAVGGEGEGGGDGDIDIRGGIPGRYSVFFSRDVGPYFLGDFILLPDGEGEFLPSWFCDESIRFPAEWSLGGGSEVEIVATELPDEAGPIRLFGHLEGCFDEPLEAQFGDETSLVRLMVNDEFCFGELSDADGMWDETACLPSSCEGHPRSELCGR